MNIKPAMPQPLGDRPSFAIVGAGATGTAVLHRLARAADAGRFDVTVFEQSHVPGPGLPYGESCLPSHLNNMESEEMSVDAGVPNDFADWLRTSGHDCAGSDNTNRGFAPRHVFGSYLKQRFSEAVSLLRSRGASVSVRHDEVIDIRPESTGVKVVGGRTPAVRVERAVLATGHWQPGPPDHLKALDTQLRQAGAGGYFSPWPASNLIERTAGADRVVVLGTSLTALDVILALALAHGSWAVDADGALRYRSDDCPEIIAVSRHGLLPRVRPLTGEQVSQIDVPFDGPIDVAGFEALFWSTLRARGLRMFRACFYDPYCAFDATEVTAQCLSQLTGDLRALQTEDVTWHYERATLRAMYRFVAGAYATMQPDQMLAFHRAFFPTFNALVAATPEVTSRRIVALLDAGRLRVLRGIQHIATDEQQSRFNVRCRDIDISTAYLVNAVGRHRSIALHPARLIQSMMAQGLIAPHPAGGIWIDDRSSAVRAGDGRVSERIFALGDLTMGQRLGTSAAMANAKYARALVDGWLARVS
ncbi:MAG: FAD/NAD(P)-binding protein [Brucellaceae bacterium]|nr:FAD/NAD(P)-binding protein [Brucellaceae bacterium]